MKSKYSFNEQLGDFIYIEIKNEAIENIFHVRLKDEIYFPIRAKKIVNDVKNEGKLDNISISLILEGMFYMLGAAEDFKYNCFYRKIIEDYKPSLTIIKKIIADKYKASIKIDAYVLLKGLLSVERSNENFEKILMVADEIRNLDSSFKDEELAVIEEAKEVFPFPVPYFYEAIIKNEDCQYDDSMYAIKSYKEQGGDEKLIEELETHVEEMINLVNAEKYSSDNPVESLKILLPLYEKEPLNVSLIYYIAVAYRNLKNYEKAIYYLIEALSINSDYPDVFNELGINYTSLNDFDNAIIYLKKAFEATKAIEICCNLILCYYYKGDMNQVRLHIKIAEAIDKDDEVLKDIIKQIKF